MNLWVNRLKQLALLPVALFFLACEDDTSYLGYKDSNNKFEGKYVELDLSSSVFLVDSIRTSNGLFNGELNRLLIGKFNEPDADLSGIEAHAAAEFWNSTVTKIPDTVFKNTAMQMSIKLKLELDYYTYGSSNLSSSQTINVYELQDSLEVRKRKEYNSYVEVPHKPEPLGSATFSVNPSAFRDSLRLTRAPKPTIITIDLDEQFQSALWEVARKFTVDNDSTFVFYDKFNNIFKGLYFEPGASNDKVVGIRVGGATGIEMTYRTATDTVARLLTFNSSASYSNVKTSWKGMPLTRETPKFTDLATAPGKRFVQAGTGIVTKVSLDNFYKFAAADSIKNVMFNSVQLVIDGVEISQVDSVPPPASLAIKWLNQLQAPVRLGESATSSLQSQLYSDVQTLDYSYMTAGGLVGKVIVDNNRNLLGVNDQGNGLALNFSSKDLRYSGFMTMLFLRLMRNADQPDRYNSFILFPASSAPASGMKSIDRAVFPSNGIKLKIFYTEPIVNTN